MNEEADLDPHPIEICRQCSAVAVDDAMIRRGLRLVFDRARRSPGHVSVAIVGDEQIARLNLRYLKRDEPTDVLSFPLGSSTDGSVEGEIVVSAETASRRATKHDANPVGELMLYIVHGALHLVGFNDTVPEKATEMHALEDELLSQLGYGRVYGAFDG